MAKHLPTIWPLEPHSRAKHEILRRYLRAWFPILGKYNQRIVYIDGFAGPGVYAEGEIGSPIIALESALEHRDLLTCEVSFLFIEDNEKRAAALLERVSAIELPERFRFEVRPGECAPTLASLLDGLRSTGYALAPTFAFLDPFGYSHTPFEIVARILRNPRCEVLITFMFEEINRFLDLASQEAHFDTLFGTTTWRQARVAPTARDRRSRIQEVYGDQLRGVARYVHAFEMRNAADRTDYFLFFATNNLLGLKRMKEAMWKVDRTGSYSFSDATNPDQPVLFSNEPDPADLERRMRRHFGAAEATVESIEEFVVGETPFRETHFKKQVLKRLELADPPGIEVTGAPATRKRGQYPDGTVLRFLPTRAVRDTSA